MRLPIRAAIAAFLLLIAALAYVITAAAQTNATKGGSGAPGTVSGRVTTADGKPVASVSVGLMPAEFNSPMDFKVIGSAKTDTDGRYKMANVPAGRYRLQSLAPLYAPQGDSRSGFGGGKLVTVGAGESVEDIDVVLVRGGVVTGRVTSPEGKPVIEERISIYNADTMSQRGGNNAPQIDGMLAGLETDDRGIYRVYGVPPGRYIVAVGQARDGMVMISPSPAHYSRTFYPNTTDPAQAKVVEVTAGGEAAGVDISLAEPPKAYEARGKIIDDHGNPVAGVGYGYGSLRENARSVGAWGTDGGVTNEDGEFTLKNLMPGRYAAFATNDLGSPTPLEVYSDAVQFEIDDANVTGLVVKVHRGASISGTVTLEGTTDRAVLARLQQVNINAGVRPAAGAPAAGDQLNAPSFSQGGIKPDGTFRLAGLRPGKAIINIYGFGQTRGFTLLGVQRNGADASAGIDIAEGEQVTGVRVRVGYGASIVRGQIDLRDGNEPTTLPPGTRMIVNARRTGGTATTFLPNLNGEVDSRGHFVLEGLMGGEYELMVSGNAPRAGRLPVVRQIVVVPDSGETSVTIIYDISKQSEPNP